jgi:hypothetical protein
MDGLELAAQTADEPEPKNATFNSWKASHFVSNVLMFSLQGQYNLASSDDNNNYVRHLLGTIISAVLNAPGS